MIKTNSLAKSPYEKSLLKVVGFMECSVLSFSLSSSSHTIKGRAEVYTNFSSKRLGRFAAIRTTEL